MNDQKQRIPFSHEDTGLSWRRLLEAKAAELILAMNAEGPFDVVGDKDDIFCEEKIEADCGS